MAKLVPPLPYKSPLLTSTGFLAEPWSKWFRDMYERIGGRIALSNIELQDIQSSDLSVIQTDITTLQGTTTLQGQSIASLQAQIDGLNQGRTL